MLNANVARSWSPSGLCLWVMRRQGSGKIKKAAWVEVEMPVRGRRYGLHTRTHTASSQRCVLAAERVPWRAAGSLHCASAVLSLLCRSSLPSNDILSLPQCSQYRGQNSPNSCGSIRRLISFNLFAPMSHIRDPTRCFKQDNC